MDVCNPAIWKKFSQSFIFCFFNHYLCLRVKLSEKTAERSKNSHSLGISYTFVGAGQLCSWGQKTCLKKKHLKDAQVSVLFLHAVRSGAKVCLFAQTCWQLRSQESSHAETKKVAALGLVFAPSWRFCFAPCAQRYQFTGWIRNAVQNGLNCWGTDSCRIAWWNVDIQK